MLSNMQIINFRDDSALARLGQWQSRASIMLAPVIGQSLLSSPEKTKLNQLIDALPYW